MADGASKSPSPRRPWPQYRSPHRSRSHQAAHSEENSVLPSQARAIEHPLVPAGMPRMIELAADLHALIDELRGIGSFGYDSEFIGEHSYFPKLCVIQVSTAEQVSLIDPLPGPGHDSGLDLTPFWELLADATIEKIVHAGMPDLEPVARHLGCPARNIFDTQIGAAFAGMHFPLALGKLIHELIGDEMVHSGRGLKFSQWDHRPLTPVQLQYAANDVRYLPLLRASLGERLSKLGNAEWATQECKCLEQMSLYEFDAASQRMKVRGADALNQRKRLLLGALLEWRDQTARHHDVPPRSLLRDEAVLAMAETPVKSLADLDRVRGLPRPVEETYGEDLVALTERALNEPINKRAEPKRRSPDPNFDREAQRIKIDGIWHTVQQRAAERSIDPRIVTSKKEIGQLLAAIDFGEPTCDFRIGRCWRRELLGIQLRELGV